MKTTEDKERVASWARTTIKALIVEGLRRLLPERRKPTAFRLRRVTFKGNGLQPQVSDASWEGIRDISYEGRGSVSPR